LVFSHGLAGSRNAYSHICGSLASHGLVVIAPDHRDGSAPISFVRATATTPAKEVTYKRYSHTPSPEVYQGRDNQLRIRLWELGCIFDGLVKIDGGASKVGEGHVEVEKIKNLDPNDGEKRGVRTEVLDMFAGKLDVHRPGHVVFAGHSFGATTVTQFVKHVYYGGPDVAQSGTQEGMNQPVDAKVVMQESLFTPDRESVLVQQVSPSTPVLLLDMWCLPLRSKSTRWLSEKPMPCYNAPFGGDRLLAVLSEKFANWEGNLNDMRKALSPPEDDGSESGSEHQDGQPGPYFFYPEASAHLSQSDFGILFPLVTGRFLKTKEPERLLRLNCRAMMQVLRNNGLEVSPPSEQDWQDRVSFGEVDTQVGQSVKNNSNVSVSSNQSSSTTSGDSTSDKQRVMEADKTQDVAILGRRGGRVRGWNLIELVAASKFGIEEEADANAKAGAIDESDDVGVMEELQPVADERTH
jgi:platelet-activating factor acetylhydrolase